MLFEIASVCQNASQSVSHSTRDWRTAQVQAQAANLPKQQTCQNKASQKQGSENDNSAFFRPRNERCAFDLLWLTNLTQN